MFKKEIQCKFENYSCVVIFTDMGHRCGYVEIPIGHPVYKIYYSEDSFPSLEVHGGITYSDSSNSYPTKRNYDAWWIGFDCGHWNDAIDLNAIKRYFGCKTAFYSNNYIRFGHIWTKQEVLQECFSLVKQLREYSKPRCSCREHDNPIKRIKNHD